MTEKHWTVPLLYRSGLRGPDTTAHGLLWQNSLLLVTLKTQSLRVLKLNDAGDCVCAINFRKTTGNVTAAEVSSVRVTGGSK